MSEHHFGLGRGKLSKATIQKVDRVVRPLGVTLVTYRDPGNGHRFWFCGPNLGEPFNQALSQQTRKALETAGVDLWPSHPKT